MDGQGWFVPMDDAYAGVPPRTKRHLKIAGLASIAVAVGGPILGMYVDFWVVVLIVSVTAAAVFIPMVVVMVREKRELASKAETSHPDLEK
jgi:cadmium resistance protein CadD (predicted permease)